MDSIYKNDVSINEWFRGSDFHHLHISNTESLGIYIPSEIHRGIRHDGKNGTHLRKINKAAFEWLCTQSAITSENNNPRKCIREIKKTGLDQIILQRISKKNMDRIITFEPMKVGDSFDKVLSRVLDKFEKLNAKEQKDEQESDS